MQSYNIIALALRADSPLYRVYALLAQLVEHLTLNQGVQGSSPWRRIRGTGFVDVRAMGSVLYF